MKEIDLTNGTKTFRVTTRLGDYMGPDVKVTARDAEHAKQVAVEHGHEPNPHFPPVEVKQP